MLNQIGKSVEQNTKRAAISNTCHNDNVVDIEDVLVGSHSGQLAENFLAKELLVSVELERPEKSSTLDYNIFTSVKDSTEMLEVDITRSVEVSLKEELKLY
ncbi:hypothetical protein POM88_048600 [Heracleum sosnowskyi]|uniref:Uncharacterized protein n=1 Tax=Heracleum sosnowskyi TaxID=360622 RepID=A0AAD8GVL9_9APIA|nr:hypothetical protein POM88_048600 [Heracleum sosnowskyi]